MRVTVVVLGDVGRSPRMQYHAQSLAGAAHDVDVVGYSGSAITASLRADPRITWHFLRASDSRRAGLGRIAFLFAAAARAVTDSFQLARVMLFRVPRPDVVLVQNPPAIPTLLIAWLTARLRSAKLVIDWHNFGYSMLALRLGGRHPLVTMARWYERWFGALADAHLCVSQAMQRALQAEWRIGATVFYDRPAVVFATTPISARANVLRDLARIHPLPSSTAVLVSATSWSADEDFSLLLDAAMTCDALISKRDDGGPSFPALMIVITGRGPLREPFETRLAGLTLRKIRIHTLWLEPEDYPRVLGAADLGLCLHRSASGLDLPMKVADMFGSGLPVCAFDYSPCLAEQIQHGVNGLLFRTSAQLADQIYRLFAGFPNDRIELDALRRNVALRSHERWDAEWNAHARPVLERP